MLYSKPKTERKAVVELVMDCQVLIWVIRCFYADPVLAFTVSHAPTLCACDQAAPCLLQYVNVDGQHMQSLQLMTGLATLVQDPSAPVLSRTAAQVWLLYCVFGDVFYIDVVCWVHRHCCVSMSLSILSCGIVMIV